MFRLATGGFLLGATTSFLSIKDEEDELGRAQVGTFDGRGGWFSKSPLPSFAYTVKSGKFGLGAETKTSYHALLPVEETEQILKAHEKSTTVDRSGNPLYKIDENVLPSKTACEDRHAIDIISRSDLKSLLGSSQPDESFWDKWAGSQIPPSQEGDGAQDIVMVSIFDGHGGSPALSRLLKKTLHPCLGWMFASSASTSGSLERKLEGTVNSDIIHDA